jgi:hypothetical protein
MDDIDGKICAMMIDIQASLHVHDRQSLNIDSYLSEVTLNTCQKSSLLCGSLKSYLRKGISSLPYPSMLPTISIDFCGEIRCCIPDFFLWIFFHQ